MSKTRIHARLVVLYESLHRSCQERQIYLQARARNKDLPGKVTAEQKFLEMVEEIIQAEIKNRAISAVASGDLGSDAEEVRRLKELLDMAKSWK